MHRFPEADTGWRWRTSTAVAVAVACVDVGHGGRFWVDPGKPDTVVAFEAPDLQALTRLAIAFGDEWMRAVITSEPLGGHTGDSSHGSGADPGSGWCPPVLSRDWARVATVTAVAQWVPAPLDERLLLIDQGVAWHAVGFRRRGAGVLQTVADVVVNLWEASHDGKLPIMATETIRAAIEILTAQAETDPDLLERIAVLERQVTAASRIDDAALDDLMFSLLLEPAGAVANDLGLAPAVDPAEAALRLDDALTLDPRFLPPRIVRWKGATWDGVALNPDRTTGEVRVSVDLAPAVDRTCLEVTDLRAIAVDVSTGQQIAKVGFTGDPDVDGSLTATLRIEPSVWATTAISVIGIERSGSTPVGTAPGLVRARMERMLLAAWTDSRLGRATGRADLENHGSKLLGDARFEVFMTPVGEGDEELDLTIRRLESPGALLSGWADPLVDAPLLAEVLYGLDLDEIRDDLDTHREAS